MGCGDYDYFGLWGYVFLDMVRDVGGSFVCFGWSVDNSYVGVCYC